MKFNSKQRNKRIMVWVSDEEKNLIEAKANSYGYKSIAGYIRDSAIYEKIINVDLKGKEEIYKAYSDYTQELKKIAKQFRHISKYATQISEKEMDNLTIMIVTILKHQKEMLKLLENKLDLDVWQRINHSKIVKEKKENAYN